MRKGNIYIDAYVKATGQKAKSQALLKVSKMLSRKNNIYLKHDNKLFAAGEQ